MDRAGLDELILRHLDATESAEHRAMVGAWVALAEADIRQQLRAPWMVRIATFTAPAGTPFELPHSYVGALSAYLTGSPGGVELEFLAPSQLLGVLGAPGTPRYICVEGYYATLFPGSGTASCRLSYYSIGDDLTAPDAVNENLARAPNVYLYAALRHAAVWEGDDEGLARWNAAFSEMVATINALGVSWSGGPGLLVRRAGRR